MATRPFDLLVFGATGFTGRLAALYLASSKTVPASLRWGIAGRNASKLNALADELALVRPRGAPRVACIVGASEAARSSRVVVSTAGPFLDCGEELVAACVEHSTDYLNITGETLFVDLMEVKYGAEARRKGVLLVPMCGFDSVPSDLSVLLAATHARSVLGVGIREARGFVSLRGSFSGGTLLTSLRMWAHPLRSLADDPLFLARSASGVPASSLVAPVADTALLPFSAPPEMGAGRACMLFLMSSINSRVVRRSASTFALASKADGSGLAALNTAGSRPFAYAQTVPFAYSEHMLMPSLWSAGLATLGLALVGLLASLPGVRWLSQRFLGLPKPGEGPSKEAMLRKNFFHFFAVATTEEALPRKVVVRFSGGDGGYADTAVMLAEGGLCLALERARTPGALAGVGGFMTPATALGPVLVKRLLASGRFRIGVVEGTELAAALEERRPAGLAVPIV